MNKFRLAYLKDMLYMKQSVRNVEAIYSKVSLLNHRCVPNASMVVWNSVVAVVSTQAIKKGEEVFIAYNGSPKALQ